MKVFVLFLSILFLLFASAASAVQFQGKDYIALFTGNLTWDEAHAMTPDGYTLAVVTSQAENDFI